jgi:hypothetical protein
MRERGLTASTVSRPDYLPADALVPKFRTSLNDFSYCRSGMQIDDFGFSV